METGKPICYITLRTDYKHYILFKKNPLAVDHKWQDLKAQVKDVHVRMIICEITCMYSITREKVRWYQPPESKAKQLSLHLKSYWPKSSAMSINIPCYFSRQQSVGNFHNFKKFQVFLSKKGVFVGNLFAKHVGAKIRSIK